MLLSIQLQDIAATEKNQHISGANPEFPGKF